MKKLFFLPIVAFLVCLFTTTVYANHSNTYSAETTISENSITDQEAEIYAAFDAIEEVVTYVETTKNITYSDLKSTNFALDSLDDDSALAFFPEEEEDSNRFFFTKQTAFLMGCVFGLPGILAVSIVNRDDNRTLNSSIWGCATSGCLYGGTVAAFYVFYFSLYLGSY